MSISSKTVAIEAITKTAAADRETTSRRFSYEKKNVSYEDRIRLTAIAISALLIGGSLYYAKSQNLPTKLDSLKSRLPDQADSILASISLSGTYTEQDKDNFIKIVREYFNHDPEQLKQLLNDHKHIDGLNSLIIRKGQGIIDNHYPGAIDKFIKEVAEELAKDKKTSMLFEPDSFVARVVAAKDIDPNHAPLRRLT